MTHASVNVAHCGVVENVPDGADLWESSRVQ